MRFGGTAFARSVKRGPCDVFIDCPLVTQIYGSQMGQHRFHLWLIACSSQCHYLSQCWLIMNGIISDKWNVNQNATLYIDINTFENVNTMCITLFKRQLMKTSKARLNLKMPSYQYRISIILDPILVRRHLSIKTGPDVFTTCLLDKTVSRPPCLNNGNPISERPSLYWDRTQGSSASLVWVVTHFMWMPNYCPKLMNIVNPNPKNQLQCNLQQNTNI